MKNGQVRRVCIIGAGASGLPSIKSCLERGLEPVCFERNSELGGICSTSGNTSKEISAFSDFPPPKEWPNYWHNKLYWQYLNDYAEHFHLRPYIKFYTEVLHVEVDGERWRVQWRPHPLPAAQCPADTVVPTDIAPKEELFDAVMVCCGNHTTPSIPVMPGVPHDLSYSKHRAWGGSSRQADKGYPDRLGIDRFGGEIIHMQAYREHANSQRFQQCRVLVVGFGNSALDLAVELSRISKKVYLLAKHTKWVSQRFSPGGMPGDLGQTRFNVSLTKTLPISLFNWFGERNINEQFDHKLYGIEPDIGLLYTVPDVQDCFMSCLGTGAIELVRDSIAELASPKPSDVKLASGSVLEDIDFVYLATGYNCSFPYLAPGLAPSPNQKPPIYKYVFEPGLAARNPTLAFIGYVFSLGAHNAAAEMQARFATLVFTGELKLPTEKAMRADIEACNKRALSRFKPPFDGSHSGLVMCDGVAYTDELAALMGCCPPIFRLFFTDNLLWRALVSTACTAYQYRLRGPNAWSGARKAILGQQERILYPLQRPALECHTMNARMSAASASDTRSKKPANRTLWQTCILPILSITVALLTLRVVRRYELLQRAFNMAF